MKIGVMNNPFRDTYEEIEWIGKNHFDFIDLTLEPTISDPKNLDVQKITTLLKRYNLGIVGHTCYYLPYAHLIKEVREVSVEVFKTYLDFFSKIGAKMVNIHADKRYPDEAKEEVRNNHVATLRLLCQEAQKRGMVVMFENTHSGLLHKANDILFLLNAIPDLMLHLDIGHAHVAGNLETLLTKAHKRIAHIHVSDNDGSFDQHLTLGAGTVDWGGVVPLLKKGLPDCSITLEIFARNKEDQRQFQLQSREKLKDLWGLVS